jgi:hypothetical protein
MLIFFILFSFFIVLSLSLGSYLAARQSVKLFGQFSGHVHAVVELGAGDFVSSAFFSSLRGDIGFGTVKGRGGGADALRKRTERDQRQSGNCNESFDGFHGRIP